MSMDSTQSSGGANLVSDVSQQRVPSIDAANVKVPAKQPGEGPASAPKLHEVSRRSPFGSLLSRTLPSYTGPYDVGVCDIEVPVERQTFGSFTHKSMPNKAVGLTLDTVLFSMFYPCEKPTSPKPVVWFPNLRQTIDGFLRMAQRTPNFWYRAVSYPLAAAAISGTTFPATKNARILSPPGDRKWQLMIFSHGVGCSRLMYSGFCGEMASRGYIVCAIEHRDGTSPSSKITSADGTTQKLDWLQWSDLQWPDEPIQPTDDTRLRHEQLKLRAAEINATVSVMTGVAKGEMPASSILLPPEIDWSRWTCIDTSRPVMAGHSLGGSAALVVSASHGIASEEEAIKWRAVVVMDPATQRIEPWTSELPHPLLVLCSEEFAVGDEYTIFAEQVAGTVSAGRPSPHTLQPQKAKGPFGALNQPGPDDDGAPLVFSIPGATHPSFSDVFLILPESVNRMTGLRVDAATVISLSINACADFLNGKAEAVEQRSVVYRPKKVKEELPVIDATAANGEPEKVTDVPKPYKPVGKAGDLVWHQFERDEQGQ